MKSKHKLERLVVWSLYRSNDSPPGVYTWGDDVKFKKCRTKYKMICPYCTFGDKRYLCTKNIICKNT